MFHKCTQGGDDTTIVLQSVDHDPWEDMYLMSCTACVEEFSMFEDEYFAWEEYMAALPVAACPIGMHLDVVPKNSSADNQLAYTIRLLCRHCRKEWDITFYAYLDWNHAARTLNGHRVALDPDDLTLAEYVASGIRNGVREQRGEYARERRVNRRGIVDRFEAVENVPPTRLPDPEVASPVSELPAEVREVLGMGSYEADSNDSEEEYDAYYNYSM